MASKINASRDAAAHRLVAGSMLRAGVGIRVAGVALLCALLWLAIVATFAA